jgi:hypothetical protein
MRATIADATRDVAACHFANIINQLLARNLGRCMTGFPKGKCMSAVIDSSAIHAIFEPPRPDGSFEPAVLQYLQGVGARHPILLLAFAPKAAGTYFRQAAVNALSGQVVRGTHAQGGRDGTPYLPTFLGCCLDADAPTTVIHMHMQALPSNRHFIEAFGLKPVIMLRDLADMLASFWDMLESDPVARDEGLNCRVPMNFLELSKAEKAEFLVGFIAPWYASYFATWKAYCDEAPGRVCVLSYADFCDEPAVALHTALSHAGFSLSRANCIAALPDVEADRSRLRVNKAVSGRGRDYFSPAQLERIAALLSCYAVLKPWLGALISPV